MSWIRRYPFGKEDPVEIMVCEVAKEAEEQGSPLSEAEKEELRKDVSPSDDVVPESQMKLYQIIQSVVAREAQDPWSDDYEKKSFSNAIGWATDIHYPLVGHLAILAAKEYQDAHPSKNPRRTFIDVVWLLLTGLIVVATLMTIAALAEFLLGKK